jgi:hypothetical protein
VEGQGGKEQSHTDWFDIEVWGQMTKFASTVKSGTPVIVGGKVKPRTHTQNDVTHKTVSIKANSIRKIDYGQPSGRCAAILEAKFDLELFEHRCLVYPRLSFDDPDNGIDLVGIFLGQDADLAANKNDVLPQIGFVEAQV